MAQLPYTAEEFFADEKAYIAVTNALGFAGNKTLLMPPERRQGHYAYVVGGRKDPYWGTPAGQEELAYWESPAGQSALAAVEGPTAMLQTLSGLVQSMTDITIIECLKQKYGELRGAFERSSPVTQCKNTIGDAIPANTPCWICGTYIQEVHKNIEALSPECEHVFPIAQALCFTGLYETQLFNQLAQDLGGNDAAAYRTGVSVEYKWAHRICNQVKSDAHFINYRLRSDGIGEFSIDDTLIANLLNAILRTNKYGGGAKLREYIEESMKTAQPKPPTWQEWFENRVVSIKSVCQTLVDKANTCGLTADQLCKVTMMSMRAYIALDPHCSKAVEAIPNVHVLSSPGRREAVDPNVFVDAARRYIRIACEQGTGIMKRVLQAVGRGLPAVDRGRYQAALADVGTYFANALEGRFIMARVVILRYQIFMYLTQKLGPRWNENGKFDVASSQIVPCAIYNDIRILCTLDNPMLEARFPGMTRFLRTKEVGDSMTIWVTGINKKVTDSGVDVAEILAIPEVTFEVANATLVNNGITTTLGGYLICKGPACRRRSTYRKRRTVKNSQDRKRRSTRKR